MVTAAIVPNVIIKQNRADRQAPTLNGSAL